MAGLESLLAYYQTDEEWMSGFNFRWWNLELNDVSKLLNECSRFNFLKHLWTPHSNVEFLNNQRCFDQSFNVTKVYKLQSKAINNEHYVFFQGPHVEPRTLIFSCLCSSVYPFPRTQLQTDHYELFIIVTPKIGKFQKNLETQLLPNIIKTKWLKVLLL